MARIKLNDLPKNQKINKDDLKKIKGGSILLPLEEVTLNFFKVEQTYSPTKIGDTGGWIMDENK